MKKIAFKFLIALTLAGSAAGLHSCGDWLDINTNELAATEVSPDYLFTNAALNYSMKRCGGDQFFPMMFASQVASEQRVWFTYILGGEPYDFGEYPPGNAWVGTYSSTGYNLQKAIGFAAEAGNVNAEAQCKILTAYVFWETTMMFGDIPYSEAWQIDTIKEPKFDSQKDVLYSLVDLLQEALDLIDETNDDAIKQYDLYYKGDMAKWRRAAKSLQLKFYMYLANKEDVGAQIKALIEEGNLLASSEDDFKFPFFDSPGNRNPSKQFDLNFPGNLEFAFYGSTDIVDPMNALDDPRRAIYFHANKQGEYVGIKSTVRGSYYSEEAETLEDLTEARFNKANLFTADYPDVLCSYPEVMFYVAECYARGLGVSKNLTKADEYYRKGLAASCTNAGVSAAEAESFADGAPSLATLGGDEKVMEAIAAQYRIEMMMRPMEAWSEQRRTGYPKLEVPEMIVNMYSGLVSRWPYPSRESLVNGNVPQVESVTTKMWFQK